MGRRRRSRSKSSSIGPTRHWPFPAWFRYTGGEIGKHTFRCGVEFSCEERIDQTDHGERASERFLWLRNVHSKSKLHINGPLCNDSLLYNTQEQKASTGVIFSVRVHLVMENHS